MATQNLGADLRQQMVANGASMPRTTIRRHC